MGIDIFIVKTADEKTGIPEDDKIELFKEDQGFLGYLRERYVKAPYATRLLVKEAFIDDKIRTAHIPASVMRARMTEKQDALIATRPLFAECITRLLSQRVGNLTPPDDEQERQAVIAKVMQEIYDDELAIKREFDKQALWCESLPRELSVIDAIVLRQKLVEQQDDENVESIIQSFYDFIELAERIETTDKPALIYADY